MPQSQRSGVFISYARTDGDEQARSLRGRLEEAGIRLWQDRENLEGGKDWWLQITHALDSVEFMVLVMTRAAMDSTLVRKEWRYARQHGVCVYPVKVGDVDFNALPRWMRSVHFYDLDQEWTKFLNDLQTRCEQRRVPFMAEDLPPDFVERPKEFGQLVSLVLDRDHEEPIAITAALRAAGGYGKTVLACALCHDEDVQNAFDDGVLWVTLGQNPGDLTGRVEDLIYLLSGQRPGFAGLEAATATLVDLLADRDILMVIDDVWETRHLKPFIQGGSRCARVITTRVADTVPIDAKRVDVDEMLRTEALQLIRHGLPSGFDAELSKLTERLGQWPLLLKLANAALRDRVERGGQTTSAALQYVNKALDRRGLVFFDAHDPAARHQAVARTIELSIERLAPSEQARFTELAIFPEDTDVPLQTLEKLWGHTGGLDDLDTEDLSERLNRLSLTQVFEPTSRFIRLHDVIRHYLVHRLGERITALQGEFLDAHRPVTRSWADLSADERYLWDHLAYHLKAAGKENELVAALCDLRYLATKTFRRNALAVERDFAAAFDKREKEPVLGRLRRCFVQSSHVFNRCKTLEDLESTLSSRLQHVPGLEESVQRLSSSLRSPHFVPLAPLPDLPHPALVRTFSAGNREVWCCAISPDGSFIASAGEDGVLTVWDSETGVQRLRMEGHTAAIHRCAVSPDNSFIVSAANDRRIRMWDAVTGSPRLILAGHTDNVTDCAISPDGRLIVSSSLDESLRVWNAHTGAALRTLSAEWHTDADGWAVRQSLSGHSAAVWACAFSPDSRLVASGSSDQTVKIWDVNTGEERCTLLGHSAAVTGCAFSPDGKLVASAGTDGTVRVWDCETGRERLVMSHRHAVSRCAFSPDGTWIVAADADGRLKIWDAETGAERADSIAHTDAVTDCAIASNASYLVSTSLDCSTKLWDTTTWSQSSTPSKKAGWVNGCAVNKTGEIMVTASSNTTLTVWNEPFNVSSRSLIGHRDVVRGCAVWPSGHKVLSASADRSLRVWDVEGGRARMKLVGHSDWVNSCCISPDERLLLSASSDNSLCVWDAPSGAKRLRFLGHRDSINVCAFTADGQFIVSGSSDGLLKVWALQRVRDAWESPQVGARRPTLQDWHQMLRPYVLKGHRREVNTCAVAPDGSFVVSGSSDRTLKIWNIAEILRSDVFEHSSSRTLGGHDRDVTGCAVSPSALWIASVSEDKSIKIWSVSTGDCVTTLNVDSPLSACAWLPDGERLVATGAAGVYLLQFVHGN